LDLNWLHYKPSRLAKSGLRPWCYLGVEKYANERIPFVPCLATGAWCIDWLLISKKLVKINKICIQCLHCLSNWITTNLFFLGLTNYTWFVIFTCCWKFIVRFKNVRLDIILILNAQGVCSLFDKMVRWLIFHIGNV